MSDDIDDEDGGPGETEYPDYPVDDDPDGAEWAVARMFPRVRGFRHISFWTAIYLFGRQQIYMAGFRLLTPGKYVAPLRRYELANRRRWMIVFNPALSTKCDPYDVRKLVLMNPDGMTRYSFTEFIEAFDVLESIGFGPYCRDMPSYAEAAAYASLTQTDQPVEDAEEYEARAEMEASKPCAVLGEVKPAWDFRTGMTHVAKLKKLEFYRHADPDWPVGGSCNWPPAAGQDYGQFGTWLFEDQ